MNTYKNGNTIVAIGDDGTKIRYVPDNQIAMPEFPESIDLKITNKCYMDPPCPMCHEMSGVSGFHGNLNHPLLESLRPYTELAIGGGDPMSHPDLEMFLRRMKEKQVICNITVHWKVFLSNIKTLKLWKQEGLVHGVGVSVNEIIFEEVIDKITEFRDAVVHCIIGVADKYVIMQLMNRNLNILLLGYKTFGRGAKYRTEKSEWISETCEWTKRNIQEIVNSFRVVSFDNLAIDQLELKRQLKPDVYNQIYMGEDGSFTMYVDLVKEQYAVSSTSMNRYDFDSNDISQLFKAVHNNKK